MNRSFDIVIVGGGVIGSSIAYHISSDPGFSGKIAVIERDPRYIASSSSLSTSAIRQQFGTKPNIAMSMFSIAFLRDVRERLCVDGEKADIGLREPGYLVLATRDQEAVALEKNAVQREMGVDVTLLRQDELAERMPWLNADDLAFGSHGQSGEGWFDGPGLLQAFRRKARSLGVEYIAASVVGLDMDGPSRVRGVVLDDGRTLGTGTVVNAAGPWSGQIARMAGVSLPVYPRKRSVFVIDSPAKMENCPFVFDASGLWMRPEGHLFICGMAPTVENTDDDFGLEVDYDLFDDLVWPTLAHRIPAFEQLRMLRAWAGLYEYNTFDHSAIIGRHPDVPNFVLATGFSGHGMMHSPAAGAGVRDLLLFDEYRAVDLTAFGIERVSAGMPINERVY